jgi:ABC-type phosphate transport system substrate-binding protein
LKIFSKKNLLIGAITATAAIAAIVPALAAYAYQSSIQYSGVQTQWITGNSSINFRISGSTTVFPIIAAVMGLPTGQANGVAQSGPFQQANASDAGVVADVEQGGSTVGKGDVATSSADIGMASSAYSDFTNDKAVAIARDGVVIIVNNSVHLPNNTITQAQLDSIYNALPAAAKYTTGGSTQDNPKSGQVNGSPITSWSTIPGCTTTGNITVVGREIGSGTRDAVMKLASFTPDSDTTDNNGVIEPSSEMATVSVRESSSAEMVAYVKNTANAIGYVGVGYTDTNISGVTVLNYQSSSQSSGVAATEQNVFTNTYALSRFLWLGYNLTSSDANISANRGIDTDLINYVKSPAGQAIVVAQGFMKLFPAADINQDDKINLYDLGKLGLEWGYATAAYKTAHPGTYAGTITAGDPADVDGSGKIDLYDLGKLGLYWNLNGSTYGVTGGDYWNGGTTGQTAQVNQVFPVPGMPAQVP